MSIYQAIWNSVSGGGGGGGSGLTNLNGLIASAQSFSVVSTGTDFVITSSGSDHQFAIPSSSASKRGLLTSADWTTFNGKQASLGFTPEDVANKSTDGTLAANSTTLYPSQSAVKTYADAKVADSITNGVTTIAPSQNAVFDALALKQDLDTQLTSLAALSYAGNSLKFIRVNAGETDFELATVSGGGGGNSFETIACPAGTNPVADSATDTLTLAIGTAGTDFAITGTAASDTITFDLPTASGSNRGALSSADWSTFNGKQAALGFTPEDVSNKSTDGTFAANSTTLYPSQSAAKTYADAKVSDAAYNEATWNGVTDISASKNAIRDIIETKVDLAGDTFTGAVIPSVVTLSDAATISVNAALGNQFTVTLAGNRTLGNPTGAVNGQLLLFAIRQDATGSRTLAYDTKFRFGADITAITLTTTAAKTDYIGVRYHSSDDKFDVISVVKGY